MCGNSTVENSIIIGVQRGIKGDVVAMRPGPNYEMALFGMVWLLRVRSEMRRCAKCRREQLQHQQQQQQQQQLQTPSIQGTLDDRASQSTFFTIDTPGPAPVPSPGHSLGPTTFCEVHGFMPPKEGKFFQQQTHCHHIYKYLRITQYIFLLK